MGESEADVGLVVDGRITLKVGVREMERELTV
jgi:hypothetical protein